MNAGLEALTLLLAAQYPARLKIKDIHETDLLRHALEMMTEIWLAGAKHEILIFGLS